MSPEQTANAPVVAPAAPEPTGSAPPLASAASVTTALSAGWLLAELASELRHGTSRRLPDGSLRHAALRGSAAALLAEVPSAKVRVRQIHAELGRLQADLDRGGVPEEDSSALGAKLKKLAAAVDDAVPGRSGNGDAPESEPVTLVYEVTQDALANLTAASTRLGRAFGLGFDLANTCKLSRGARRDEFTALFGTRVVDVQEALADLATSLPQHAGRGTSLSLAQWQHWAMNPRLSKRPVVWPQEGVEDALARQGQVWRAILSGEKLGKDMLATDDYFGAVKTLARRLVIGRPWLWLFLFGFVSIAVLGVYLLVAQKQELAKLGGAALSAVGAVGVSAASLKRGFAGVAKEMEAQLWGAELDYAIAEAITVPPGDWRVRLRKIELPPPRGLDPHIAANARVVHMVAGAISKRTPRALRIWHVQKHLHDECRYQPLTDVSLSTDVAPRGAVARRLGVARRLVRERSLGSDPEKLVAGAPGRLVSLHRGQDVGTVRALVWTFRHGRLLHLQEFGNYPAAQAASRLPGPSDDESDS
jgi:hypothetical protein